MRGEVPGQLHANGGTDDQRDDVLLILRRKERRPAKRLIPLRMEKDGGISLCLPARSSRSDGYDLNSTPTMGFALQHWSSPEKRT